MNAHQKTDLRDYLSRHFDGEYILDEPLSRHTWYKIGGPADVFAYPRHVDDLIGLLRHCRRLEIPTFLIGDGANLLVHDAGFRGVVVSLERFINQLRIDDDIVNAEAGVLLNTLVLTCEQQGRGGLEALSGIPGTVGGALMMNAGTNKGEIGDHVKTVTALTPALECVTLTRAQIQFGYRRAPEIQDMVVLGCQLTTTSESEVILRERRVAQLQERAAKQPLEYPSCGSVFKRPPGHFVGKLVQDVGLKGVRQGDAMIPEKHGGFIINLGHATAADVMFLIQKVQAEVLARFGVVLEPEVRFVGF